MARHNEPGSIGEEEACRFLMHSGYRLLDRNWRWDIWNSIVADYYGELVFVEVKSRSSEEYGPAELAVDLDKQQRIPEAAQTACYAEKRLDQPFRYDIITVRA